MPAVNFMSQSIVKLSSDFGADTVSTRTSVMSTSPVDFEYVTFIVIFALPSGFASITGVFHRVRPAA